MTLPGMPLRVGDPGVFVCGPADIDPDPVAAPAPRPPLAAVPYGATAPVRRHWLVLNTCSDCNPRTGRYCNQHGEGNWWLTNWGNTRAKKTRPARPLDAGA